ncbi:MULTISPECIES: rhodanese-like domain-containing protein [Staphylococcus]|uniref:Rhodanese-like domain-containing protein n=1 Tax=Staphylococcus ureilyticus TaxID=94138 RepID=A0AB34AIU9_STAUR|nr:MULTISPECIES: rhodanese-like domain-containing protein [Staphylococcus]AVL77956.1 rhodanese-like domain-containing protein [Staphylococcus cohnii]MBL0375743.1 rhodanese-like domain-containing protein [Staphylococcus sp. S75]MBL0383522.1 rhodanese-like domain-containing protein [Staphylococcus sp. S59]MBL0399886.1 rhodanese-like domain-containing protein [Staphylococcus sp. S36]MCT1913196.1 rhodanese-like domain-containing protein [Staphylococcus ureilyticus]
METITIDELKSKILNSNPVHIVDVRTDEETAMGVIPDAETIPMDKIPDNLSHFNSEETYYIICKAGGRSAQVVQYLERNGIHAVNVEGGMDAWGDEGLEIKSI